MLQFHVGREREEGGKDDMTFRMPIQLVAGLRSPSFFLRVSKKKKWPAERMGLGRWRCGNDSAPNAFPTEICQFCIATLHDQYKEVLKHLDQD